MSAALFLLLALAPVACRGPAPDTSPARCAKVHAERTLQGMALCEDVWTCDRPPGGRWDRIGLRRIAPCAGATGSVVLYLPGMHMNASLPLTSARHDLRLHLAVHGVASWGIDYRTHAVPPSASPEDLRALAAWTTDVFTADVTWAAGFVRGLDPGPLWVAGFSHGATLAYALAARRNAGLAGLVILDGALPSGRRRRAGGPAIDVAGRRLPFAERARLLSIVARDPGAPSPVAGFETAGEALAKIVYSARSFGGRGGLANTLDRLSDLDVLARLLASYDRWWPRATLDAPPPEPPGRALPVLAFASTRLGPEWIERVRSSARAFGGAQATVRELPGYGHLDVLVARRAARDVFTPVLHRLRAPPPSDEPRSSNDG